MRNINCIACSVVPLADSAARPGVLRAAAGIALTCAQALSLMAVLALRHAAPAGTRLAIVRLISPRGELARDGMR